MVSARDLVKANANAPAAEWYLEGYVGKGVLGGITGKPKVGKTTLKMHEAVAIAGGVPFRGQNTVQVRVWWLNLEMPPKLLLSKFQQIFRQFCDGIAPEHLYLTELATRDQTTIEILQKTIGEYDIGLLYIDSLYKWAQWEEENSSVDTDRKGMDPLLQLCRELNVGIEFIHHCAKVQNGGSVIDAFRGSGTIGAALDIGTLITRPGTQRDTPIRKLESESRYEETPPLAYVRMTPQGYEPIENPTAFERQETERLVLGVVNGEAATLDTLLLRLNATGEDTMDSAKLRKHLNSLIRDGKVEKGPKDSRKDTYRLKETA
jgi:RecA-family ATPase